MTISNASLNFKLLIDKAEIAENNYQQTGNDTQLKIALATWKIIFSHPKYNQQSNKFQIIASTQAGLLSLQYYDKLNQLSDLEFAINLLQKAVNQASSDFSDLVIILHNLGLAHQKHYKHTRNISSLKQSIDILQQTVDKAENNNSDKAIYLNDFGIVCNTFYLEKRDEECLKLAIQSWEDALQLLSSESPYQISISINLAGGLNDLYLLSGKTNDIERAINLYEQAKYQDRINEKYQAVLKTHLADALHSRYEKTNDLCDLDRAIGLLGKVLLKQDSDPEVRAHQLNNLAKALFDRYQNLNEYHDLESSIENYKDAKALLTTNSSEYANVLNGLSLAWRERFHKMGEKNDLQQAIQTLNKAIENTPKDSLQRYYWKNNLALMLYDDYSINGNVSGFESAMGLCTQAIDHMPDNDPTRLLLMDNMSNLLQERYQRLNQPADLKQAIKIEQETLEKTDKKILIYSHRLSNLGGTLIKYYRYSGDINDLTQAIDCCRTAITLCPENAVILQNLQDNLGTALREYYNTFGDLNSLDEAISLGQNAVKKSISNTPNYIAWQNNLAICFQLRYRRTSELKDLEQSIDILEKIVRISPIESTDYINGLNNLGSGYRSRYLKQGKSEDLTNSVNIYRQLHEKYPIDLGYVNNLALALLDRYEGQRVNSDLLEATKILEKLESSIHSNSLEQPKITHNIARSLLLGYKYGKQLSNQQKIFFTYHKAAQEGLGVAVEVALESAIHWCDFSFLEKNWDQVIQAYHYAHQASKQLLQRQLLRNSREIWLRDIQGLSSQAAYAYVQNKRLNDAVLSLEQSSAQLLSSVLKKEIVNLNGLEQSHPNLYQAYLKINKQLVQLENNKNFTQFNNFDPLTAIRKANDELQLILEEIQKVPGNEHLFKDLSINEIQSALLENSSEALVYITVTTTGSILLIVTHNTIIPLRLSFDSYHLIELLTGITIDNPENQSLRFAVNTDNFSKLLTTEKVMDNSYLSLQLVGAEKNKGVLIECLAKLGQYLIGNLANQLRKMKIRRLFLIPIGRLGLLPLHAAHYTIEQKKVYFCDEFVISYVPNALALITAKHKSKSLVKNIPRNLLGVANTRPRTQPLNAALVELETITELFTEQNGCVLYGVKATQSALLEHIYAANHLHFACHGLYNFTDVLASHLLLSGNEKFSLSDLLFKMKQLLTVRLVVLSACRSGIVDFHNIPDESVGLPAGFLQAGAQGVISTLWAVDDVSTAFLMIRFYQYYINNNLQPAQALLKAQSWLRNATGKELKEWGDQLFKKLINKDPHIFTTMRYFQTKPETKPYSNPYYWAGFILTGL